MTLQVVIREYRPEDETPVLGLLNLALGTGRAFERSSAFFRWKHLENPFGASLIVLANGAQIIGLRAFLRWQFRAGGTIVQAARAVDTATHPEYQRMGIFSRLTTACLERAGAERVSLIFNTPNRYSLPGYLKLGWTDVGRTTVMVRPLRPLQIVRALVESRGSPVEESEDQAQDRTRPVDNLLATGDTLARLLVLDDATLASGVRTARSVPFLRWRYAQAPSLRYGAHWLGDREMRAATIYRLTHRRGLRELMLCELFLESAAAGRRVVGEVLRAVHADYAVAHHAPGTPHRRVLLSLGFLPLPRQGPHFTVRPLAPHDGGCDPRSPASWRLSLGDLEVF